MSEDIKTLQESVQSGSVPGIETEHNEIDIEEIVTSLYITEQEKEEITREKILELVSNRGCTSTESIKRALEKIYKKMSS